MARWLSSRAPTAGVRSPIVRRHARDAGARCAQAMRRGRFPPSHRELLVCTGSALRGDAYVQSIETARRGFRHGDPMRTLVLLVVMGCSGANVSPLETAQGNEPAAPDGGPCGMLGESCCFIAIAGLAGDRAGVCLQAAGVPCGHNLTCEPCGGDGQIACTEGNDAGAAYYAQPNFCNSSSLAAIPPDDTCVPCGGRGQPCCITGPSCHNAGACSALFTCP